MVDGREAPLIISILLLDDDEVKTRGKTRSWIKRRKQRGVFSNKYYAWKTLQASKNYYQWIMTEMDFLNLLGKYYIT